MARRPIIGITTDHGDNDDRPSYRSPMDYARSVERAGGLPWLIPFMLDQSLIGELVDHLDGVLFSGGSDLNPSLYNQTYHPKAEPIDPARQNFELALLAEVERRKTPALGVCLGSQLMNVHRGGSLIQFLPESPRDNSLEHRRLDDDGRRHPVNILPNTLLSRAISQKQIVSNTRHKQAVDRLGKNLRVAAAAPDGVVEAVEDPSLPLFLGVQWHPENLSGDHPEHLALFKLLVEKSLTKM